jgi:hypothetical protein
MPSPAHHYIQYYTYPDDDETPSLYLQFPLNDSVVAGTTTKCHAEVHLNAFDFRLPFFPCEYKPLVL